MFVSETLPDYSMRIHGADVKNVNNESKWEVWEK